MQHNIKPGDKREYRSVITSEDVASFQGKVVHPVMATYALAREIEWTTRLFVLAALDEDEEGIGTFLSIDHKNPAFVGEEIIFTAWVDQLNGNELICFYEARIGDRLIALGKTGQKILKRDKIQEIFRVQGLRPTQS
jgi:fluoroacetyl-CoA thioesterase